MEATVVFIFSEKREKGSYFHFFFLSPSELKSGTMPALCPCERSGMEPRPTQNFVGSPSVQNILVNRQI